MSTSQVLPNAKLPDKLRQKITQALAVEPSDTVLADKFGVSRKTIWRLRQKTIKTNGSSVTSVVIPDPIPLIPNPTPVVATPLVESKQEAQKGNGTLSTYFAIQQLRLENYKDVVHAVLLAAQKANVLFQKIQVLEVLVVGSTTFVRLRADIEDITAVMQHIKTRAYIIPGNNSFELHFSDGRTGRYPSSIMCTIPKLGFGQTFFGTNIQRWQHQFKN